MIASKKYRKVLEKADSPMLSLNTPSQKSVVANNMRTILEMTAWKTRRESDISWGMFLVMYAIISIKARLRNIRPEVVSSTQSLPALIDEKSMDRGKHIAT